MKNLVNGGFEGEIYPINPKAETILGRRPTTTSPTCPTASTSRSSASRRSSSVDARPGRRQGHRRPRSSSRPASPRPGEEELQHELVGDRARARRPASSGRTSTAIYYLPQKMCAAFSTPYDVRARPRSPRSPAASGWRILGFARSTKLGVVGDRRPRQQGRHRRGRPADVLRAGRQHAVRRPAHGGPQGRPRVRRGRPARVAEEADRRAQGRRARRPGAKAAGVAHRGAGRRRQGLRRHPAPGRRRPRARPARPARATRGRCPSCPPRRARTS